MWIPKCFRPDQPQGRARRLTSRAAALRDPRRWRKPWLLKAPRVWGRLSRWVAGTGDAPVPPLPLLRAEDPGRPSHPRQVQRLPTRIRTGALTRRRDDASVITRNSAAWQRISEIVRARDRVCVNASDGRCRRRLEVHHIVPLSHGGMNQLSNVALVRRAHHEQAEAAFFRQTTPHPLANYS